MCILFIQCVLAMYLMYTVYAVCKDSVQSVDFSHNVYILDQAYRADPMYICLVQLLETLHIKHTVHRMYTVCKYVCSVCRSRMYTVYTVCMQCTQCVHSTHSIYIMEMVVCLHNVCKHCTESTVYPMYIYTVQIAHFLQSAHAICRAALYTTYLLCGKGI